MKKRMRLRRAVYMKLTAVLIVLGIGVMTFLILDHYGSTDSPPKYPEYEMTDLDEILDIEHIYMGMTGDEEEKILFLQTGLGKRGIEALRNECQNLTEFSDALQEYQSQLFLGTGEKQLVSLEDGDILVSMSQRLCFYPHGHAAIVIDEEENEILEAKSYRAGSCVCGVEKWSNLSSIVVLRVKEDVILEFENDGKQNPAVEAVRYAEKNLNGLEYSLFKDLRPLSGTTPEYTQCAHLVWYAYYTSGLDIDENRGLIIKPKDFLRSDTLEIVQVFGIEPNKLLELRDE